MSEDSEECFEFGVNFVLSLDLCFRQRLNSSANEIFSHILVDTNLLRSSLKTFLFVMTLWL